MAAARGEPVALAAVRQSLEGIAAELLGSEGRIAALAEILPLNDSLCLVLDDDSNPV